VDEVKKLPLGMQGFREIKEDGYLYIDKTKYVYNILNEAKYYFLSRPRRFGKSLLLDTIAEVLGGDRELFSGLFIYDSDYSFEKHPVLRLDMSNIANETPEILKNELLLELRKRANDEGFDLDVESPSALFKNLIEALNKKYKKRVVVLIDEYDKPILDRLSNIEVAETNRDVMRGFYGILKSMDPYLRLTFITGITKFTKTSVFSGLNNLRDITLTKKYANICGISADDLGTHFSEHIEHLSNLDLFSEYASVHDEILSWYDGYSWDGETRVINPFSLLSFFIEERFSSFWYASGTPKFLLDLIKIRPRGYAGLSTLEIGEWELDTFDVRRMEVEPMLFQTGYLTVRDIRYNPPPATYLLEIPNYEVRQAFNLHVLAEFTESGGTSAASAYRRISESLKSADLRSMLITMRTLFSSIPYQLHIKSEYYYHSIFYAIMTLLGFDIDAEVSASGGRIDAVLELDDKVYIMEFKYEECPADATAQDKQMIFEKALCDGIKQINDRGYAKKYEGSEKTIYKAAFAFLGRDDIEMRIDG